MLIGPHAMLCHKNSTAMQHSGHRIDSDDAAVKAANSKAHNCWPCACGRTEYVGVRSTLLQRHQGESRRRHLISRHDSGP